MSTREIVLDGGSPWGFRMHGGADVGQPLRISRVNPGSKAAQKGVREGDVISSINGQSTRNITNSDAHALLRNAGQTLHLGLNEECSGSPKRRLHRNIQESKSDSVKRSTVTKTTTLRTTTSVNGATDPNCNNQVSVKSNVNDGQNGGVKESSTVSAPDSKGQRRRRRQQSTPGDAKDDSNAITDKTMRGATSSEDDGSKTRRRRRSRGTNRRKCRVGNALGVESDVSVTEQKAGRQDVPTTEPETDATMSDVGPKIKEEYAQEDETSVVDIVEEIMNKDIQQEVVSKREQVANVHNIMSNEESLDETVNDKFTAGVAQAIAGSGIGKKQGNATSFVDTQEGTRKKDTAGALSRNSEKVMSKDSSEENELEVLRQEDATEVGEIEKREEISEEEEAGSESSTAVSSCKAISENIVMQVGVPSDHGKYVREIVKGRAIGGEEIGNEQNCGDKCPLKSEVTNAEIRTIDIKSENVNSDEANGCPIINNTQNEQENTSKSVKELDSSADSAVRRVIAGKIASLGSQEITIISNVINSCVSESDTCKTKPERQSACPVSEQFPPECRAFIAEAGGEEVWEEVEELCETENICEDDQLLENAVEDGDEECLIMMNTPALLQDPNLSQEDKDLLDPHPLIDAEDEETLRRFLHSLNLVDYSKEAVRARSAMLRDGSTIEEVYATRRSKRRPPLDAYCNQQSGLEVILEENSSDYSDGEKRMQEARALEGRSRGRAWEEAIFIPETNQLVFLNEDEGDYETLSRAGSEETVVRNRSLYYSETQLIADGMENGGGICRVYQRVGSESSSVQARIVSEDVSIDVFSEDMENTLENVGVTEECDSEDDGEERDRISSGDDAEVRVELAESSEDEDDVKGTWKRGRAQERQEAVEIVYLEEDSGSASSGSCMAAKKTEEDADGEEEDVLYEGIEFPVVRLENVGSGTEEESSSVIYENVEFHRNKSELFPTKQTETDEVNSNISINVEQSSQYSDTSESLTGIYEDVEFVRKQVPDESSRESSSSTSIACNEANALCLPGNSNVIFGSDSRPNYNTHTFIEKVDENKVTEQLNITACDGISDPEGEEITAVDSKNETESMNQSVLQTESISQLESSAQASSDTKSKCEISKENLHVSSEATNSAEESGEHTGREFKESIDVSETVNSDNSQKNMNSKTIDIVKRILSLMPQRENIDNSHLESIVSQLISLENETESLKENSVERIAVEVIETCAKHQQKTNDKNPETASDTRISNDNMFSEELEHNPNSKTVQSDPYSRSPRFTTESNINRGYNTHVESIVKYAKHSLSQIDSDIKISNESLHFNSKTAQHKPDFKSPAPEPNTNREIMTYPEQEKPFYIPREYGGLRSDEDGLDDLDSVTPTNRSRHESSSSDAGSHGTAVYCPGRFSPQSSDADVSSYAEDAIAENKPLRKTFSPLNVRQRLSRSHENILESKKSIAPTFNKRTETHKHISASPRTLRDLSIDKVVSFPRGVDILDILGIHIPEKDCDNNKRDVNTPVRDAVKRFQLLNDPSVSARYQSPLSGSLPDLSFMKQEQSSTGIVVNPTPPPVLSPSSLAGSHWLGMPTKQDPNLFVCLSPSQRQSYHQGETPTPEEAGNLLDLHRKFIQRRGYHENPPPTPSRRIFGIRHFFNEAQFTNRAMKPPSSAGRCVESQETSTAPELIPSPRSVLTSLDSKIHTKQNTRDVIGGLEDAQVEQKKELGGRVNEDKSEDGGGEKERDCSTSRGRSSSRLLAILRASSEPQEFQAKHLSPSSSCSPPALPPLPHAYQHQLTMLGFSRRPTTVCCNDFDFLLQHGPPRSPSCNSQSSLDSNLQSPIIKTVDNGKTPSWSSPTEGAGNKKERISSWYGQDMSDGNNRERLKVRSLSDWLQLVRFGGSNKDVAGSRSKDSTPPVSACISTQSSPGPIRRVVKDASPKPETRKKENIGVKEHQKLKQEILERRFSLPERRLEEVYQHEQKLVKPPLLSTSARDDERHEQQFKLLLQRQQRLRNQILANRTEQQTEEKRPPLPQLQSKQKQTEVNTQERVSPIREEQKKQLTELQEKQYIERRFDAENYRISKKGDIAIINSNVLTRLSKQEQSISRSKKFEEEKCSREIYQQYEVSQQPNSMPPPTESLVTGCEIFRQQMYLEYMNKVAERAERRRHKVIRLSSAPREDATLSETQDAVAVHHLENEFMGRVRERMDKLGLKYDEESDDGIQNKMEIGINNCYVVKGSGGAHGTGGGGSPASQLPKHLQEFLVIAGSAGTDSDVNSDVDGVWSPSLKPSGGTADDSNIRNQEEEYREGEDVHPVVWTPKSAGASPTTERKEFRPVNFESPTLPRKIRSATSTPAPVKPADDFQSGVTTSSVTQDSTTNTTFSSIFPPWQQQQSRDDSTLSVGSTLQSPTSEKSAASSTITSTLDRRLVQSQSAPASGLSALAAGGSNSIKLPRAQNPTITLLQKAREGQLPRGALYLDHKMNSKEGEKPYISPNEILYTVKKEYESEGENEQRKKIVELGPRKFEGIGPMTKEGIPIVLRSEVKDANQAKWYKRMYDSLHRAGKDDEYITIRYKPRKGHYPYTSPGGYLSEPEPALYDSDIGYSAKYATLDRRRIKNKENDFTTSTLPRSRYVPHPASIKYATEVYKNQPGRIEDYEPGHSSISDKETKQWWDEVLDIFDGWLETHSQHHHQHQHHPNYRSSSILTGDTIYQRQAGAEPRTTPTTPSNKPFMTYALKESGYESDSTLVFKRRDENLQSQLSPADQKLAYKTIQKGGEVPLHGLRKLAPERPKESPHRYVESEVTIHYRSPVRSEAKEVLSEEELARRQAEAMRRIYQEERRRKYLQELQDMHSRRHTDNFTPSQKSPIPLNRYDDFLDDIGNKGKSRDRTPEPKLVARALYNFVGQTSRELSFRRGDIIFVRRQVDKNWYEGEHNAMVGLFPFNYVEIIPYDGIRTIPKRPNEGQARAKFNFIAKTHLELSLVKGELVVLTRRVDDNWFEGRIGNRKGIFPVSYVEVLSEPGEKSATPLTPSSKPITLPASHTVLMNGSGIKQSMGQHSYQPSSYYGQNKMTSSYTSSNPYATLPRQSQIAKQQAPVNQTLHIDTHSEPVPYRALYNYRPQNEDELELCEGDTVYVMEKCDDGWYVGSSQRTGYFGTFPGNYVERI